MIRTLHHKQLLVVIATAALLPPAVLAQPAPRAGDGPTDTLTTQDREILTAAEQLATESSQVLEQWIITQAITEDRLFARLYFPIAKTDPQKYSTPYDELAERDIVGLEDKALARVPLLQYAIVTDLNGYVPAHNTRFAKPLTGNAEQDYINNRTKRMLGDAASLNAGRSETRYLIQHVKLETGDMMYDLSVPVTVRGKHWGCARIGYRRTE
jgi:methyl-accepting chemotaxis protein